MSFQSASKNSSLHPRTAERPPAPVIPLLSAGPRPLWRLRQDQCRYCLVDTPPGRMDEALFCAAPASDGAYCPAHRARCVAPSPDDFDALAADVAAALQP